MPQTTRGLVYPDSTGHTRTWEHWQTLAETADAAINTAEQNAEQNTATAVHATPLVQTGSGSTGAAVAAGAYGDVVVTFPTPFAATTPGPVAIPASTSYNVTVSTLSVSATGATFRVFNNRAASIANAGIQWIAVGARP